MPRRALILLVTTIALTGCASVGAGSSDAACSPEAGPAMGDLPIAVADVLIARCQPCHQSPPLNGAPFPLMSYEDTLAPFNRSLRRWQRMAEVIDPTATFHMPPPGQPQLTVDELATLRGWLATCAQPVPEGTGGDNGP